jgi:hypothetical protein
MFAEMISKSNIISLVEDSHDEESGVYRATIRVLPQMTKRWIKVMTDILREAHDEEGFEVEPHKSYYWDSDAEAVRFVWVLLIWGDLDVALASIGDLLATNHAPVPIPPTTRDPRFAPTAVHRLEIREVRTEDGVQVRTRINVPHAKPGRYQGDEHEIVDKDTGHGRLKARVVRGTAGAFAPKKASEI